MKGDSHMGIQVKLKSDHFRITARLSVIQLALVFHSSSHSDQFSTFCELKLFSLKYSLLLWIQGPEGHLEKNKGSLQAGNSR